jgi:hypothetical protein
MALDIHGHILRAAMLLATMTAVPVSAQEDAVPDGSAMAALEAAVPPQTWYPDGYYDVRIAAEAQVAETPRGTPLFVGACPQGGGLCYDPFDPLPQRINPSESDPAVRRYGDIALHIARLRQELAIAGYPLAVYSVPLADYERKLIETTTSANPTPDAARAEATRTFATALEAQRQQKAATLPRILGYGEGADLVRAIVLRSTGPSAALYPAGKKLFGNVRLTLKAGDQIEWLDAQGTRTLRGPGVFTAGDTNVSASSVAALARPSAARSRLGAVRSGGASGIVIQTNPPSGEVLLVSAFAFRICQRKTGDPWDRFTCKWNEIETGVARPLSGRFVYQVRWPDGTVRKGTREIAPTDTGAVTFKKVGS